MDGKWMKNEGEIDGKWMKKEFLKTKSLALKSS
jgi:hypothetical protein